MNFKRKVVACVIATGMVVTNFPTYPVNYMVEAASNEITLEKVETGTVLTLESGASSSSKVEWKYGNEGGEEWIDSQWCEFADSDENAVTRKLKITKVKPYQAFAGSGYITITASVNGRVIKTWKISTISGSAATALTISKENVDVNGKSLVVTNGKSISIAYTTDPEGCEVEWTMANKNVATLVNNTAYNSVRVTGVGEGETVLTAKTKNGIEASVTIIVKNEKKSGNYTYMEGENGTATITAYNGSETDIKVPDTLGNCKVVEIANQVFTEVEGVETIEVPEGIEKIGDYAFAGNSSLVSIKLPKSVTSIGNNIIQRGNYDTFILCYAGSYAESYAVNNNLKYISSEDGTGTLPVLVVNKSTVEVGESISLSVKDAKQVTWSYQGEGNMSKLTGAVGLSSTTKTDITVTGEEAGTVTITANVNGYKLSCQIEVTNNSKKATAVLADSNNKNCPLVELKEGQSAKMQIKISSDFAKAEADGATWSSSDKSIATVKDGTIQAIKAGECVVSATLKNGMKATCNIVVSSKDTDNPQITDKPSSTVKPTNSPQQTKLPESTASAKPTQKPTTEPSKKPENTATVKPTASAEPNVTLEPSKEPTKEPQATTEPVSTKVKLNKQKATIYANGTKNASVSLEVANGKTAIANGDTITWNSLDKSVASVKVSADTTKAVVTAKKAGTTVITMARTTLSGEINLYTAVITVKKPVVTVKGAKTLKKGRKITLKAITYGLKEKVTWSVNNKKLASISSKGVLKAKKKAGKIKVTATCGKYKKTVQITIK